MVKLWVEMFFTLTSAFTFSLLPLLWKGDCYERLLGACYSNDNRIFGFCVCGLQKNWRKTTYVSVSQLWGGDGFASWTNHLLSPMRVTHQRLSQSYLIIFPLKPATKMQEGAWCGNKLGSAIRIDCDYLLSYFFGLFVAAPGRKRRCKKDLAVLNPVLQAKRENVLSKMSLLRLPRQ